VVPLGNPELGFGAPDSGLLKKKAAEPSKNREHTTAMAQTGQRGARKKVTQALALPGTPNA
jgi:hypothetical protein